MKNLDNVVVNLDLIQKGLTLTIYSENGSYLNELSAEEANELGEAPCQVLEGKSYEYVFSCKNFRLKCNHSGVISQSQLHLFAGGRITPNIYVGTLAAYIYHKDFLEKEISIHFEVLASKFDNAPDKSYRVHYRLMVEGITQKCTELLMQINSPIHQNYEVNFDQENQFIYQRFCFVKSIIASPNFEEALQKIISNPKTKWSDTPEWIDTRKVKRFNQYSVRQLISGSNKTKLQKGHSFNNQGLDSLPNKIRGIKKIEDLDNPENRFIKHSLKVFLIFCQNCYEKFGNETRERKEADLLIKILENYLNHDFFQKISNPSTLELNSPVLQRKSGYREILNSWMMFDLAAKLIWKGGDDVYQAGKRDIATLYEYWLFFTLYDLFKEKFRLDKHSIEDKPYQNLFDLDKDGINLLVKAGKHVALNGIYDFSSRSLEIKFSYNRTFNGGITYEEKESGSWTSSLRPDLPYLFGLRMFLKLRLKKKN